jgi:hypothetical protein
MDIIHFIFTLYYLKLHFYSNLHSFSSFVQREKSHGNAILDNSKILDSNSLHECEVDRMWEDNENTFYKNLDLYLIVNLTLF